MAFVSIDAGGFIGFVGAVRLFMSFFLSGVRYLGFRMAILYSVWEIGHTHTVGKNSVKFKGGAVEVWMLYCICSVYLRINGKQIQGSLFVKKKIHPTFIPSILHSK